MADELVARSIEAFTAAAAAARRPVCATGPTRCALAAAGSAVRMCGLQASPCRCPDSSVRPCPPSAPRIGQAIKESTVTLESHVHLTGRTRSVVLAVAGGADLLWEKNTAGWLVAAALGFYILMTSWYIIRMETDRIRIESDSNSTFYHILNWIRIWIQIFSDTNAKRISRIRILVQIFTWYIR